MKWYIFAALTNKKLLLLIKCRFKQNFLFDFEKLIEYWASAVQLVLSNLWVGPKPRNKISFLLLQYTLMSSHQTKCQNHIKSVNENPERESNPKP